MNITYGQTNSDVGRLQQQLIDGGFLKIAKPTNYFGDLTLRALQAFQKAKGLPTTGQYDTTTQNFLEKDKVVKSYVDAMQGTPYGNALSQAYLANDPALYAGIERLNNPLNAGAYLGNGQILTESDIQSARDLVSKQVNPYYEQYGQYQTGLYGNELGSTQGQYQNSLENLQSQYEADVQKLNEQEATQGTWDASARKERMDSLTRKYNQETNRLANLANADINKLQMNREYNYGTGAVQQSPILKYTLGTQNYKPITTTSTAQYNPFGGMKGIKPTEQAGVIEQMTKEKIAGNYPDYTKYINF